jgi:DNA-binding NtrC family response regulator
MTAIRNVVPDLRSSASILVATPNVILRERLVESLRPVASVAEVSAGAEALDVLERRSARIVVLDRKLPDLNCDELIGVVEQQFPGTDVILLDSDNGEVELPEELCTNAAYRCFQEFNRKTERCKPPQPIASAISTSAIDIMPLPGLVGTSESMRQLASLVRVVARHSTSVLITGETGSGKELVAEAVHKLSPRAEKPFVTINCAAIPDALIESELFGHTRGAFTGAVQSRLGRIHAAHGGTIFFDEIGELPVASQSKLLRFLESGEVQRLGTSDVFRLDARVIAATNVDLEKKVAEGLFREDLFYRLSVFPIALPPLRERPEDIPALARHFLQRLSGGTGMRLGPDAEAVLVAHQWPGNVRELRNVIERAFILADGGPAISPEQIKLRKSCGPSSARSEAS